MDISTAIAIVEANSGQEYFGGWTPQDGIDSLTERTFMEGECGYLAAALAEATGWRIVTELNGREGNHVWCINDAGRAVDIRGVHRTAYATFPGSPPPRRREVEEMGLEDQLAYCENAGRLEWARAIVAHFPEHFGIG